MSFSHIKEKPEFETAYVDLDGIMLSDVSQTVKDRYCVISLTCGIYKTKSNHRCRNRLMVARGQRCKNGKDSQKICTSKCKMNESYVCNIKHCDYS